MAMEVDIQEKVKSVFDVCDTEGTGYISVDHLKDLARDHFGADSDETVNLCQTDPYRQTVQTLIRQLLQELSDLGLHCLQKALKVICIEAVIGIIQLLDPEGKGKVNFKDFCTGVQQILEVQGNSKQSTPTNSGNYTDLINAFHFTETSPVETQDTSEASAYTFNEYDTNTDEDGGQLLIDFSTPETSRRNLFPVHGHSSGRSSVNSKTDEENFEDYGVVDLESDSSDANLSCDSCQRSRRSPRHRQRGPHRRITSAAYASQLTRGARSPHEDIYDDIDGSFQEMNSRIKSLEKQLVKVSEEKTTEGGLKNRFKDENSILIKRIHTLEEQLRDVEVKSDERVQIEQRKYADIVNKHGVEQEKMDYLTMRLQTFEEENERLKVDAVRLKNDNDRLRMDKMELSDRLSAMEEDYNRVSAEYNDIMSKFDREQEITGNLLDELQKELEDLRKYKIECDRRHGSFNRSPSVSDSNGYPTLQAEMSKLRETLWSEWKDAAKTNKHLAEENEELNAQLLAQAVKEGRHVLQQEGSSLAEELDHMTKEELMSALRDQQDVNNRLKQYVDKILVAIIEKNPAMLEKRN